MALLLNILWLIFGGLELGLSWLVASLIMFVSIVGIPWGRAAFNIAVYTFFPFGNEAISRYELTGEEDIGTGPLGFIGNIIWFIFAGIWLALAHLVIGVACFISIIGIPFGVVHFKLVRISLAPIGMAVVPKEVAEEARRRRAGFPVERRRPYWPERTRFSFHSYRRLGADLANILLRHSGVIPGSVRGNPGATCAAACRSPLDPGFRRGDGMRERLSGDSVIAFDFVSRARQSFFLPRPFVRSKAGA